MDPFNGAKIEFPTSFDLKVIMKMDQPDETLQFILKKILENLKIPHSHWSFKVKGVYISYSIYITLENHEIMDDLYRDLKEEPLVKFAI